jgi:hypothetical protein
MKADYSRFRFNINKGYTRVLQQQGRVTLDADWNEQVSIQADLDCKRSRDVIGHCGVPYADAGFLVSIDTADPAYDLHLGAGTIYIAGHRINLDDATTYATQPFLPDPPTISAPGASKRVDLVYLCVRERHVTYLEDETIREIALGGPDTTTRVQTIWQVHVREGVSLDRCEEDAETVMEEAGIGAGLLTIIKDHTASVDDNPCVTPADSDYRGLENRLYRVEVHEGGTVAGGASVKWSRYNGAVAFKVVEINASNRTLTLARLGWDQIVTLSPNSWIELVSEEDELAGRAGAMLQISSGAGAVNDAQRQVTLKNVTDITTILNGYTTASNVKVRLWDTDEIALNDDFDTTTNTTEIILEDGIGIKIGVDNPHDIFRTGDYWTFTARTIIGRVEELSDVPPQGPEWHCCKLALIHWNPDESDADVAIEDCRPLFPALTEMLQLHYVGGDGQEGKPGDTLQSPLMVRVSRGEHPVENLPVIFEVKTEGLDGKVFTSADPTGGDRIVIYTDGEGLVNCQWQLGNNRNRHHQSVMAFIDAPADARHHQQVNFNANLSIAEEVSYLPPGDCINIGNSVNTVAGALDALCSIAADGVTYTPPGGCTNIEGTTNVAQALDALCSIEADGVTYTPPGGCTNIEGTTNVAQALDALCSIEAEGVRYTPPEDCTRLEGASNVAQALDALCTAEDDPAFHVEGVFWLSDGNVAVHDQTVTLAQFIGGLLIQCDRVPEPSTIKQASVFMTLELPSNTLLGVQMAYILEGDLEISGSKITWKPTAQAEQFLIQDIGRVVNTGGVFLARLFLKGSKIYLEGDPSVHLDGNVVNSPNESHHLMLPSGDGEEGGTFEMWFNLKIEVDGIYVVGVLHPNGLIGFETTSISEGNIILDKLSAINLRLDALDLGYHHRLTIESARISGYTISGTLYNEEQARLALYESGAPINIGFEVIVLVQREYRQLANFLIEGEGEWVQTFGLLELSFTFEMMDADSISYALRVGLSRDKLPSLVICDNHVLDTLRNDPVVGEPDGIVRFPFFRRV